MTFNDKMTGLTEKCNLVSQENNIKIFYLYYYKFSDILHRLTVCVYEAWYLYKMAAQITVRT